MRKATSIYAVAEYAKVSPSTVSRVITGRGRIGGETIAVVRRAIKELGYQPTAASGRKGPLKNSTRRTNRVALLAVGFSPVYLNSPVYMELLRGIESSLAVHGQMMVLRHLTSREMCGEEIFPQRVDGALVFGETGTPLLTRMLSRLPHVRLMNSVDPDFSRDHVTYDNALVGRLAARHLLERNQRQAAFISADHMGFWKERGAVFNDEITRAGGTVVTLGDSRLLHTTADEHIVVRQQMLDLVGCLLEVKPRITGVFLSADNLAPAFYSALTAYGARPEDWAIVSCNNERILLAGLHPRPATIDIHAFEVGRRSVEHLLHRIGHPLAAPATLLIRPTLILPMV